MKSFLRRYRNLTAIVAALFLTLASVNAPTAAAQSNNSGAITGIVTDASGAVIPGAAITLIDPSTKLTRTTQSNGQGQYVLVNIVPGTYKITAVKPGFSTDEIAVLTVSVGTQTTANFKMAVGAESTTVDVQASNADLQTMNASTGQTVDPAVVDSLPSIGREVASFATLQPGVTPGGNVAGTTTDQASFALDGGNNSSDMDGTANVYTTSYAGSTTGGFLAAAPQGVIPMGQDSVEEFKVTTTGQTADFNNSSGSQTQVVTRRGHDKLHGSIYEYYLDNNFNANSWQNNFPSACYSNAAPTATCPNPIPTAGLAGSTSYTPKPSYHYSRFGVAAGGPIAPYFLGGKTYLFGNYEGFRWPNAATIERVVPSYNFLQNGILTLSGTTYSANTLTTADPRGIGFNTTLQNFYKTYLPQAPVSNNGSVGATGVTYAGTFDQSCGALSTSYCDGVNVIGYKANASLPNNTDTYVFRMDHDFGQKWHLMASYREYKFNILNSAQTDVGGALPGDTLGQIVAVTPRPQKPWYFVTGLTTNISSSLTNDFHYSYLRNYWQWKGPGASPSAQGFPNAGGVIEPLGEQQNAVLAPFNVNAQQIRTRIWNGHDNFLSDNLTKLKGDHLVQFGGQFQHNYNYHLRTDNGNSINYTPTYQIGDANGAGNVTFTGTAGPGCTVGLNCVGGGANSNNARFLATYYGLVTDTQVANTYTNNNGTLSLNAPATPFSAKSVVPYYNIYLTDTWRVKPNLTVNYGLGYAIEMPPTEQQGSQVMFTDSNGNAIRVQQWLAQRKTAAISGQVYNPYIGFALVHNVNDDEKRKYPYDPFYGAFSPHVSFAWNPKFANPMLSKMFGDGSTVIRAGYSRIYGRLNGDVQVLNPILAPGLVLATQCKYSQHAPTPGPGTCNQSGFNDSTAYRFGVDGQNPITASAAPPVTLSQPYRPGLDGPGVAIASPDDPSLRPNDVDTFNFSVQRQVNRKMLVEVGYIGRLIHHEYIYLNPNQVPYQLSVNGQSFESAYIALEGGLGCTISASQCATSPAPTAAVGVAKQPFFENGINPSYCNGYANCTTAVLLKQLSNFRTQKVFNIWSALDAGTFTFPRSLMGSPTSNATYGSAGQVGSGMTMATSAGYSNYNAAYVSFKTTGYHGLTAQENLTYGKAMGLGAYTQSTSGVAAQDSFNLHQQYGRQGFDQKYIFNTFLVYETPWYKDQSSIVGRLAGGWTLSPVLTAGTGQPLQCTTNNSGQGFGGEDGSNITGDGENCIFTSHFGGRAITHRAVYGGVDPNTVSGSPVLVGTAVHAGAPSAAVNFFSNPISVYDTVRPAILGLDNEDSASGPINGLGYLNLDFSIKKKVVIYEKYSLEFSGVFYNVMNHLDFSNPTTSLASVSSWGVTKTQGNSPRQIQMGMRANF